jgi:ABC-2 type transport system ATP-binding protein
MSDAAIATEDLGKRFGSTWALRDCTIAVPRGSITGLVGSNGAGKTTLIRMLAALARPSSGRATVAGREPADTEEFLAGIGYVAQEAPLYRGWTAADHLSLGRHMNPVWDDALARERLESLRVPLDRPVQSLSGGMRAQVALALALGKRPQVLLLDEPVAALDPLARREFLGTLAGAVADTGVTALLSSHLLPDLERVCDHLVLLAHGRPVVCAAIEDLLETHKLVSVPPEAVRTLARQQHVVSQTHAGRRVSAVVELQAPVLDPAWEIADIDLEEIVLAYLADDRGLALQEVAS